MHKQGSSASQFYSTIHKMQWIGRHTKTYRSQTKEYSTTHAWPPLRELKICLSQVQLYFSVQMTHEVDSEKENANFISTNMSGRQLYVCVCVWNTVFTRSTKSPLNNTSPFSSQSLSLLDIIHFNHSFPSLSNSSWLDTSFLLTRMKKN